jgi:3-isopropylmalate dehydrogenase
LSAAMLLRHSLRLPAEAQALENAVDRAISLGKFTADLAPAGKAITTRAAADAVLAGL